MIRLVPTFGRWVCEVSNKAIQYVSALGEVNTEKPLKKAKTRAEARGIKEGEVACTQGSS